ncbi:protein fem-1 homolog b [Plakobranchus ocellatus]|uniref:Protein fem-1 homolog b n=1 Tax=Plakobranchus ocellatus TaxID=259542 RepID=A0AAV3YPQ1_9GAST|nr:protein fem-1 homolog b [Plakobranchus ocellatus]
MHACRKDTADVIKELLTNNASVNVENQHEWTCLMFACGFDHTNIVRLLLIYNADFTVKAEAAKRALNLLRLKESSMRSPIFLENMEWRKKAATAVELTWLLQNLMLLRYWAVVMSSGWGATDGAIDENPKSTGKGFADLTFGYASVRRHLLRAISFMQSTKLSLQIKTSQYPDTRCDMEILGGDRDCDKDEEDDGDNDHNNHEGDGDDSTEEETSAR